MKRLSIKFKITFWFTLVMVVIVIASLYFMFGMGQKMVKDEAQIKLSDTVSDSFNEIDYRFGEIDIDDDLDFYNEGVYISVYDSEGRLLYGRLPTFFNRSLPFSNGAFSTMESDGRSVLVYDLTQDIGRGCNVTVRGVLATGGNEYVFGIMFKPALILFPILLIIAAFVGYILTKHAFAPVNRIVSAAESISSGNDLTKRIGLGGGGDEIHRLANEFDMMFDRLQESFENEKRFTSDASHELRTPLAVILAECESLLDSGRFSDDERIAIESIYRKAEEMSKLVSSLLTLARADRGHLKLDKAEFELSAVVEAVAEEVKVIAEEKNISVSHKIQNGVYIDGDETMIIRMLLNICENAVKYGRVGGKIDIEMTEQESDSLIIIKDDGIGIKKDDIKHIWERFYRVDEARSNGNGLGLPLAKYIAVAHGGDISVESEYEIGSCFTIKLPKK